MSASEGNATARPVTKQEADPLVRVPSQSSTISVDSDDVEDMSTTPPKVSKRRKLVIDRECVNPDCQSSSSKNQFNTASSFVVSFYGIEVEGKKKRKVCPDCRSNALDAQAKLLQDLFQNEPVVNNTFPRAKEMVTLEDSDVESTTDTSSESEVEVEVGVEESIEKMIESSLKNLNFDSQIQASVKALKERVDKIDEDIKETDKEFEEVESQLDQIRTALYQPFRPELQFLPPLHVQQEVLSPVKKPAVASTSATAAAAVQTKRVVHEVVPPPADLPPIGKLERTGLSKDQEVYTVRGDILNQWEKGKITEVVSGAEENSYKVRIPRYKDGVCVTALVKLSLARLIAYAEPASVRLQVGTRIIGCTKTPACRPAGTIPASWPSRPRP